MRLGVDEPTVALLSNGEEPGKGDALRKAAWPLLAEVKGWIGNVEGRDLLRPSADVIITDGFTGNVALKTVEGALAGLGRTRVRRARRAGMGIGRRLAQAPHARSRRRRCFPTAPAARSCSA